MPGSGGDDDCVVVIYIHLQIQIVSAASHFYGSLTLFKPDELI
jgi:hypothetical protein